MKNFKKVLALVLAFAMVLSTMTTAFAATANDSKAATLNELGLFDGKSTEEFMPALEDQATAPEALKLIGTALGWEVDPAATTTFEDVPAWAAPWVAKAVELGVTNGISDTEFGADLIDGQRVATWFLRALGYDNTEAWTNTAELATTAGLTIPTSTLRDDVVGVIYEGLMATPVDGDQTLIAAIVAGDDNLTAIAEAAGLVDATLAIDSAMMVGTKVVEVKLNKAVDTDATTVKVKQGAAIFGSTTVWNDAMNTATVTVVIDLSAGDYTVEVATADETLSKAVTVADEASASIAVTTTQVADDATAAEVDFVVANQYGEDQEVAASDVVATAYNVTASTVIPVNNTASDSTLTLDLSDVDFAVGDAVRVTISYLGMNVVANLTSIEAAADATFAFGDVTLASEDDVRLTASDTGLTMDYTLLDQYGAETTLADADASAHTANEDGVADVETIGGVLFTTSDATIIDPDTFAVDTDGVLTFAAGATDGTAVITAIINATGQVANTSVVVNAASGVDTVVVYAPTSLVAASETVDLTVVATDQFGATLDNDGALVQGITWTNATMDTDGVLTTASLTEGDFTVEAGDGTTTDEYGSVTFDVKALALPKQITAVDVADLFENGANTTTDTVTKDEITVYDQYGREYTSWDDAQYDFRLIATDSTEDVFAAVAGDIGSATGTYTFTDSAVGTEEFTLEVVDLDDATDDGVAAGVVAGSTYTFSLEVVDSADISSYEIEAIDTLGVVANADYYADVTVVGKTSTGKTVQLDSGKVALITSSDDAVATITGGQVNGETEGTATIKAYDSDGALLASTEVTVSEDASEIVSVAFDTDAVIDLSNGDSIATNSALVVKDQYGVDVTAAALAAGTVFTADAAIINTSGVATGAGSVDITFVSANGISATETLTVQP